MTVINRDLAQETPDWVTQPGRHCGEFCVDLVCKVCREYVPRVTVPANIELGSE